MWLLPSRPSTPGSGPYQRCVDAGKLSFGNWWLINKKMSALCYIKLDFRNWEGFACHLLFSQIILSVSSFPPSLSQAYLEPGVFPSALFSCFLSQAYSELDVFPSALFSCFLSTSLFRTGCISLDTFFSQAYSEPGVFPSEPFSCFSHQLIQNLVYFHFLVSFLQAYSQSIALVSCFPSPDYTEPEFILALFSCFLSHSYPVYLLRDQNPFALPLPCGRNTAMRRGVSLSFFEIPDKCVSARTFASVAC